MLRFSIPVFVAVSVILLVPLSIFFIAQNRIEYILYTFGVIFIIFAMFNLIAFVLSLMGLMDDGDGGM